MSGKNMSGKTGSGGEILAGSKLAGETEPSDSGPGSPDGLPLGTIEASADRFRWSPPLTPATKTARKRIRTSSLALVVAAAIWSGSSVWTDGLDAVVFALIVPLMIAAMAVAVDRLFAVGDNLRIEVAGDALTVKRGRARQRIARSDIVAVSVASKTGTGRSGGPAGWYVVIDRADAKALSAIVPRGSGSAFDRREAALLEAELRQRCGL